MDATGTRDGRKEIWRRAARSAALIALAAWAAGAPSPIRAAPARGADARAAEPTTVVVVRHAEKATDDPSDPSLSAAGQARAAALVAALDGAPVAAIYATQFKRTRATAQPLARRFSVPVQVRPVTPANASAYAAQIAREVLARDAGKTVVIVGHSNTVPDLVRAFGARPVTPLAESDFDRIFIIVRPPSGPARLFQARYGPPGAQASP